MVCSRCGCEQVEPARFCRQCGMSFSGPPVGAYAGYYVAPRVPQHLQPLAILWFVFGAMRLLSGFFAALALHTMARGGMFSFNEIPPFLPHLFATLAPMIAIGSGVMGGLALLVGWSLSTRQPWGRTLAIVVGILELIKIPFGTALGIYTLWVLAPAASGVEWRGLERAGR